MKGKVIADRYRLVRELGSGAMGTVWLAEHLTLGSEVAIKLIHAETAKQASTRARFDREARIVALIRSAHVVSVIDHGTTDAGQSFIAMEYLTGESLADRLRACGRLTPYETAKVVRHVARAMTRAHDAGLVHRDLKPDNIFIAIEDESEVVKVLDFGVAKATDVMVGEGVDPTRTGALLGTPYYMSPEQAQGLKSVDARADLWSLGVIVYECLTGKLPFQGNSLGLIVARIMRGELIRPSQQSSSNANSTIDSWMERALCREPDGRFQTARELSEAFATAVESFDQEAGRSTSRPPRSSAGSLAGNEADLSVREATTDTGTVIVSDPDRLDLDGPVGGGSTADGFSPAPPLLAEPSVTSKAFAPTVDAAAASLPPGNPSGAGHQSGAEERAPLPGTLDDGTPGGSLDEGPMTFDGELTPRARLPWVLALVGVAVVIALIAVVALSR
ncbi:MAG: serine/threonine protein kinase [Deltaproteobacteria bacterium]|jgi:serine/threonine-protein kinase|nr:serine/threonine protein kinase [Deltaproteobacteria bacterium]MBW2537847.1 serine/threonine protein kinase [Deltaproteobacteria bacterium]